MHLIIRDPDIRITPRKGYPINKCIISGLLHHHFVNWDLVWNLDAMLKCTADSIPELILLMMLRWYMRSDLIAYCQINENSLNFWS